MANLQILISGASIAGPTLAYFLSLVGASVTIVERSPSFRTGGQGIDIRGAGRDVVKAMNLFEAAKAKSSHESGLMFVNEANGVVGKFAADQSGGQSISSDVEILRGELARLIYEETRGMSGVKYVFGDTVESLTQEGAKVHVTFSKDERTEVYDLVVAADGLGSKVRDMAFGLERGSGVKSLGSYTGYFSIPAVEMDSGWSRAYSTTGGRSLLLRPDDEKTTRAFICATGDYPQIEDTLRKDAASQKAVFEEIFKDAGWESRRILDAMHDTEDWYCQKVAQVKLEKWSKGHVTVVGDAGYCPSPITGMGTSVAFVGAYVLAGEISKSPNDIPAALASYEQVLRPWVEKAQWILPGAPGILNPQSLIGLTVLRTAVSVASFASSTGILGWLSKVAAIPALSEDPFKLPDYEALRR